MIDAQPTVVSLSDAAATKLRELTKDETNPEIGLRVYVYSGGCSGYRYGMMLEDRRRPRTTSSSANGVRVYIDSNSVPLIQGSEIDYVDTLMGAGSRSTTRTPSSGCGCGSSFRTADDAGTRAVLLPLTVRAPRAPPPRVAATPRDRPAAFSRPVDGSTGIDERPFGPRTAYVRRTDAMQIPLFPLHTVLSPGHRAAAARVRGPVPRSWSAGASTSPRRSASC